MKQKYTILKDEKKKELIIKEFAELDKEVLSFLCEERYGENAVKSAIEEGKDALVAALRTHNMYPPVLYADKISEAVMSLYASEGKSESHPSVDIFIDDLEFLTQARKEQAEAEEVNEESEDIDDLLEDDIEDDFDKSSLDPVNSPLKIADDDSLDVDDD